VAGLEGEAEIDGLLVVGRDKLGSADGGEDVEGFKEGDTVGGTEGSGDEVGSNVGGSSSSSSVFFTSSMLFSSFCSMTSLNSSKNSS
jgi:hypothetical protein